MPNGEIKRRSGKITEVYKRFMATFFPLQKRQDAIIEDIAKKADAEKIEEIRKRLSS